MEKRIATPKSGNENKLKQMWIILVTLPDGKKYVDGCKNKTPKEKLYWYFQQIQRGKDSAFLNEVRKQCNNRTDNLELKILDFGESNNNALAAQWLNEKRDEWIERLGTDNEMMGGLNQ